LHGPKTHANFKETGVLENLNLSRWVEHFCGQNDEDLSQMCPTSLSTS